MQAMGTVAGPVVRRLTPRPPEGARGRGGPVLAPRPRWIGITMNSAYHTGIPRSVLGRRPRPRPPLRPGRLSTPGSAASADPSAPRASPTRSGPTSRRRNGWTTASINASTLSTRACRHSFRNAAWTSSGMGSVLCFRLTTSADEDADGGPHSQCSVTAAAVVDGGPAGPRRRQRARETAARTSASGTASRLQARRSSSQVRMGAASTSPKSGRPHARRCSLPVTA